MANAYDYFKTWMGGVKKCLKHAYAMFEWSLSLSTRILIKILDEFHKKSFVMRKLDDHRILMKF